MVTWSLTRRKSWARTTLLGLLILLHHFSRSKSDSKNDEVYVSCFLDRRHSKHAIQDLAFTRRNVPPLTSFQIVHTWFTFGAQGTSYPHFPKSIHRHAGGRHQRQVHVPMCIQDFPLTFRLGSPPWRRYKRTSPRL